MNPINICCVIFFLFFSHGTLASSWYQVEVIIFDRINPNLDGEQWQNKGFKIKDNLVKLQATDRSAPNLIPYMILDKSRNRLNGVKRILRLSSEYRPLLHLSWQQPATTGRESRHVHLQKLAEQQSITANNETLKSNTLEFIQSLHQASQIIDGSIRIRSGFHLHVDIDLFYFNDIPLENKIIRTSEESFSDGLGKIAIRLKESRKIKLHDLHYFDHPMYGVILQVSRL